MMDGFILLMRLLLYRLHRWMLIWNCKRTICEP